MSVVDYVAGLPYVSCCMHFNDTIIEDLIPGYRTLYVSGRDSYSSEVFDITTEVRDFSRFRRRRRLNRELTLGFAIVSESPEAYHKACNKLKGLLFSINSDEAIIWFDDESDVFYKGSITNVACDKFVNIKSGGGTITIRCSDPRKYGREEKIAEIQNGVFTVDYEGTYPAFPILEATAKSELGYISFTNQNNKVLLFGTGPDDAANEVEKSEIRFEQTFTGSLPSTWSTNTGTVCTDLTTANGHVQNGTAKVITQGVTANSWGSAAKYNTHGVMVTRQIPNSSKGVAGAKNWTVNWEHLMYSTNLKAWGEMCIIVAGTKGTTTTKQSIAEVHIVKNEVGSNAMRLYFYVNNKSQKIESNSFTCEQNNSITGTTGGKSSMTKLGTKYTFNIGTKYYEFTDSTDLTATEVTIMFNAWKDNPAMTMNAVKYIKFTSHGNEITSTDEIPNPFAAGDTLVTDVASGSVKLNDSEKYGLGALGNDWEEFYLTPGANEIQCLYGDDETSPEFKMRYREVYL